MPEPVECKKRTAVRSILFLVCRICKLFVMQQFVGSVAVHLRNNSFATNAIRWAPWKTRPNTNWMAKFTRNTLAHFSGEQSIFLKWNVTSQHSIGSLLHLEKCLDLCMHVSCVVFVCSLYFCEFPWSERENSCGASHRKLVCRFIVCMADSDTGAKTHRKRMQFGIY